MGGTAAAVLPINSEHFDFHGFDVEATRDLGCRFCPPKHEAAQRNSRPTIAFVSDTRDAAVRVHGQLVICADHLRELADMAEQLAPEPWNHERNLLDEES